MKKAKQIITKKNFSLFNTFLEYLFAIIFLLRVKFNLLINKFPSPLCVSHWLLGSEDRHTFSYLFSPVVMVFVKKKFIRQQLLKWGGSLYICAMMMWIRVRQLEIVSKMNNKNDDMAKNKRNNQKNITRRCVCAICFMLHWICYFVLP